MELQQIIEFISALFTKGNITFALAVFGSLGTAYTLFLQRKKLSLSIHYYSYKNNSLIMYLSFTNHSHLPISISSISIVHNDICYPCAYIPTKVIDRTHRIGKEIVSHQEILSIQFPVSLLSLAGTSGYLHFGKLPDTYPTDPTTVTLEVSASRGKAKRMKLSLPQN